MTFPSLSLILILIHSVSPLPSPLPCLLLHSSLPHLSLPSFNHYFPLPLSYTILDPFSFSSAPSSPSTPFSSPSSSSSFSPSHHLTYTFLFLTAPPFLTFSTLTSADPSPYLNSLRQPNPPQACHHHHHHHSHTPPNPSIYKRSNTFWCVYKGSLVMYIDIFIVFLYLSSFAITGVSWSNGKWDYIEEGVRM